MATIAIQRSAATILSPLIDDRSKRYKTLNGADYITLSFKHDSFVEFFPGDYISWDGVTYTIKQVPQHKKLSETHYEYDLRFEGPYHGLKEAMYLLDDEGEFFLTGTAEDFIDLMVANLNRVHGAGTYNTGSVAGTDFKNLQFNNESCWDVLIRICEEFELEFSITAGININLATTVGSSTGLSYEYHSGLKNINRIQVSGKDLITRLFAYGSEKNIDYTYGANRLHLPSATYPDRYMESGVSTYGIREEVKHFDDIYPSFTGTVDSSSANNVIVDAGIDFDINSYLLEGITAKIVFKTGDLAGMQFDISEYNHSTHTVTFNTYTDEHGQVFPSATFNPDAGDQFTFVDINMPTSYITAAESALQTAASDYLSSMSAPNVIYELTMDQHALRGAATSFDVGDIITITDAELAIGGMNMRIIDLTQSIADEYNYIVKLGDVILRGYLARMRMAQADFQRQLYANNLTNSREVRNAMAQSLQALSDAADAQSTADGKIVAYYQDTEPSGGTYGEGDIWFDTNDGYKIYVYHSGAWVESQDTAIADAINAAQTAQTTADGKAVVFYQDTAPASGMAQGDIWIDTNDSYRQYVYSGSAWVESTVSDALQALADAAAAQSTADGKITAFYQDSEPSAGESSEGDIWFDTNDGNRIYVYESGSWVDRQDSDIAAAINSAQTAQTTADGKAIVFYQTTAPSSGMAQGDIWVDTDDDNIIYVFSGSAWVEMTVVDAAQALADAAAAQAAADGKVATFYQDTVPTTGMSEGDIWFDTSDGNKIYVYYPARWVIDTNTVYRQTAAPTAGMDADDWWIDSDGGNAVDVYNVTWYASVRNVFAQDLEPTSGMVTNDYWIDTDGANTVYQYNGSSWVLYSGTTYIQDTQPTNAITGAYWFDLSDSYTAYYSTGAWQNFTGTRFVQTTAPTSGMVPGDAWFDSDDAYQAYVFHDAEWVNSQDSALAQVIDDTATAQASADGKVTTFFAPSTEPPTAEGIGDLWYQTDNGVLVRWNGTDWDDGVGDHTQTVIDGGIVTTGRLVVMNSTTEQGGISGTTGSGTTEIGLWLGATYASRASAPFRVTHGGAVTMTNATISTGTSDYSNLSGNTLTMYSGTNLRAELTINGSRGDAGELYVSDGTPNSASYTPIGMMRGSTADWIMRWESGDLTIWDKVTAQDDVYCQTDLLVGDLTSPYAPTPAHAIVVASTGSEEESVIEVVGNRTTDNTVGSLRFCNTQSSEGVHRVAEIVGYRYSTDDGGRLVKRVADTSGVMRTTKTDYTWGHHWSVNSSVEMYLGATALRPYTNNGLDLGGSSYYWNNGYITNLYLGSDLILDGGNVGGDVLQLKAGSAGDHVYMEFFADSSAQSTRSAWIGYASAGSTILQITNEFSSGYLQFNAGTSGTFSHFAGSTQHYYSSNTNHTWYLSGTNKMVLSGDILRPYADNGLDLGSSSYRWNYVYSRYLNLELGTPAAGDFELRYDSSTGAVSRYTISSDKRLKKNLTPIKNGLEVVLNATAYTYMINRKGSRITGMEQGVLHAGVITQDFHETAPELVSKIGDTGYERFDYQEYTAYQTQAIQTLHAQNESLKKKILKLEKRLCKLEERCN